MHGIDEFLESMAAHGLQCPDTIVSDGVLHRFNVNGDKPGSKNGWYVFYGNDGLPAGAFGSWKLGETFTWCEKGKKSLSDAERTELRVRIAEAKKARDQELKRIHLEAREKAAKIWKDLIFITEHPYLTAKGVKAPYPLREDNRGRLVIPIIDTSGIIHSLQFINSKGSKKFLPDGAITGHFSFIKGDGETLLVCEGYSTGASLHEATGYSVACALNCGNLKPVCEALHEKSPDIKIIVCGDDDHQTDGNPGLAKAKEAAEAIGAALTIPKFKDQAHQGTDFNDLHQAEGLEAVKRIIEATQPSQVVTPDDLLDFEILEKPHLDIKKFSGITKAFVELATQNSEADPAAVLFTFLARFGVEVGRKPYFMVGDTVHHGRLDCVVVGDSSKSRKGTSEKPVNSFFSFNSLYVSEKNVYKLAHTSPGPFSSGEGVIYKVHDQVKTWDTKTQSYQITDPGISDKRLFICDEEFNNVLANVKREGNTLSMVIRKAWDDGTFEPLTKNSRMSATNAHVGWVCHITGYELRAKLSECEGFNGFANRILWVFARRQKLVPLPEPMPTKELAELQRLLLIVLEKCHEHEREIAFTEEAKEAWVNKYYRKLSSRNGNGLLAVVLNRSEAQVRRLALLFTLLDCEYETSLKHLDQAMAAWQYCEDSACYIFKGQAQDSVARKILAALQDKGQLTGTELSNLFSRNIKSDRLQQAIQELVTSDMAEMVLEPTKGRPSKTLKLKRTNEINEINEKRSDNRADARVNSLNSFNSYRDLEKKPDDFEDTGAYCSDCDDDILS